MATKVTFTVPAGSDVMRCRKCPQWVAWITTTSGRAMPVNLSLPAVIRLTADDPEDPQAGVLFATTEAFDGESHFATCPYADTFRRRAHDDRDD